ncbi:putative transcription factor ARF family [Helianthus anomalus]
MKSTHISQIKSCYFVLFLKDKMNDNPEHANATSFAKTLTQSDANNGGSFSVPRYCAETIFPRLDYMVGPPLQNILAKDVHGNIWKFRHIYRGTPRRHLLTTGWSTFVNKKKLVAGDSIVFLRADNGDICVGIRRVNRGFNNGRFCGLIKERGKLNSEPVIEAAKLAAKGQPFEVFYYPGSRSSAPKFCVKASTIVAAHNGVFLR